MLPTYAIYVFAQSRYGIYKKGAKMSLGFWKPKSFATELLRECDRHNDDELSLAPLRDLQNKHVLLRDSGTCKNRFPCGFRDTRCMRKEVQCRCVCQKAICRFFQEDFKYAMAELNTVPI